jgi:hypothetical protein
MNMREQKGHAIAANVKLTQKGGLFMMDSRCTDSTTQRSARDEREESETDLLYSRVSGGLRLRAAPACPYLTRYARPKPEGE